MTDTSQAAPPRPAQTSIFGGAPIEDPPEPSKAEPADEPPPAPRSIDVCPVRGCGAWVPIGDTEIIEGAQFECAPTAGTGGHRLVAVIQADTPHVGTSRAILAYTGKRWRPKAVKAPKAPNPTRGPRDPSKGRAARDKAMAASAGAASGAWIAEVEGIVKRLAKAGGEFTADDIWKKMTKETPNGRALGGVLKAMSLNGIIEPTDRFIPTVRASRHAAPIRVWRAKSRT